MKIHKLDCIVFFFLDRIKACTNKDTEPESTELEYKNQNFETAEDEALENGVDDRKKKGIHKADSNGVVVIKREPAETDDRHLTTSGAFNIVVGFYQIRSLLTVDVGTKYRRSNTYQAKLTQIMNLDFNFIRSLCPLKELASIGEGFIRNQLILIVMLGWALLFLIIYFVVKLPVILRRANQNTRKVSKNDTHIEIGIEEKAKTRRTVSEGIQKNGRRLSIEKRKTSRTVSEGIPKSTRVWSTDANEKTAHIEINSEGKPTREQLQNNLTVPQRIGLGMIKIILFGYKNVATFAIICFHCVDIKGSSVLFINGK